jgi:hypothetical protein
MATPDRSVQGMSAPSNGPRLSKRGRPWLAIAVTIVTLNALFLVFALSTTLLSQERLEARIESAFERGDLVENDYLSFDTRRGDHQYNDCNILQMLVNRDTSPINQALGPWIYYRKDFTSCCLTLRELVTGERRADTFLSHRYTRYWHGYFLPTGLALSVMELHNFRVLLLALVVGSILLIVVAAAREPFFLPFAVPIAVAALAIWGVPHFAQGISHGFGDAAAMAGLALLMSLRPDRDTLLLPFCAAYGCVVAYFEMLTGPLPTASGLLFVVVYLRAKRNHPNDSASRHLRTAVTALAVFAVGATATVITHVVLVAAFVQPHDLHLFAGNLDRYTGAPDNRLFAFAQANFRLLRRGTVLTFGSTSALLLLCATTALCWIVAGAFAWKRRRLGAFSDFLAFVVGAASVPAWVFLLTNHTLIHAGFMARILIVPIALGWSALVWELWRARTPSR